jgi:hypothetical protein
MPLQNRVDPWGKLCAVAARGTLTGNRGIIHNQEQQIIAQWRTKAWITCQLAWKGWWRPVMGRRSWTELFFLDEATAFAAGHRPCATCRRERFTEFKAAWLAANPTVIPSATLRVTEIDAVLHAERTCKDGKKITYEEELRALADGTMIETDAGAYLIWQKQLLKWSFDGYTSGDAPWLSTRRVRVLTPASIVRTFRSGFRPDVHESVRIVS